MNNRATTSYPEGRIALPFTAAEFDALSEIYTHFGTTSFNNTVIRSPFIIALEKEMQKKSNTPAEDIAQYRMLLYAIHESRELQKQTPAIEDTCMMLEIKEYVLLLDLIRNIIDVFFKYRGTFNQFLDCTLSPSAAASIHIALSYCNLSNYKHELFELTDRLLYFTTPEIPIVCSRINQLTEEVDRALIYAVKINDALDPELSDLCHDNLIHLLGVGFNYYTILEKIKSTLVSVRVSHKLDIQFSAFYFLNKLLENKHLKRDPLLEVTTLHAKLVHLYMHEKNFKSLLNTYQTFMETLENYHNNNKIEEVMYRRFTCVASTAHLRVILKQAQIAVTKNELDNARAFMLDIQSLLQSIQATALITPESTQIGDDLFENLLKQSVISLEKRLLHATKNTIDMIIEDTQSLKNIWYLHFDKSPKKIAPVKIARGIHQENIRRLEKIASEQKQRILTAEKNAHDLALALDEKSTKYEEKFDRLLSELTNQTENKIKAKPKPKERFAPIKKQRHPAPSDENEADAVITPEENTPPTDSVSISEQARHFFETQDFRHYACFVESLPPEDQAEALLYAADYHVLGKAIDAAIPLYEQAYTLAKQSLPINNDLIDNVKLSLMITHEHLATRLAQSLQRQERLNKSRENFIMYLGYYAAANDPNTATTHQVRLSKAEYHQYIQQLGMALFKNIGDENRELNVPHSKYTAQREYVKREIERLTKSSDQTQQLLDLIDEKPDSALMNHSVFKPPSPAHPKAKKKTGNSKRRGRQRR